MRNKIAKNNSGSKSRDSRSNQSTKVTNHRGDILITPFMIQSVDQTRHVTTSHGSPTVLWKIVNYFQKLKFVQSIKLIY